MEQRNLMPIKVECAYDEMVDIEKLVPNPRNPNKHPDKQISLLSKIISAQGWRNPIVVSNRSGFIIKGHARLEAARKLECETVPVDYQNYENEAAEYADMLADNRIAELAEPDLPGLKDLLQELDTGDFDMDLTGFDTESLEGLMTGVVLDSNEPGQERDGEICKCPKCGFEFAP
jgi:ParB-like chromosome segregation protein Spo0J